MKIHRFFIKKEAVFNETLNKGEVISLHSPSLSHQFKNVLKFRNGEKFIFFTGNKSEYLSELVSLADKNIVSAKIIEVTENKISFKKEVYLFFSLIKKSEFILEKGTEVGVSHFVPIISKRSEKKDLNFDRSEKIIIESSEQCGRVDIPKLYPIQKLDDVFQNFLLKFYACEKSLINLGNEETHENKIGIFIGPEGGWTNEELELFEKRKVELRSLGSTILRSETAAIVSLGKIL